jgi:amino acid transporter
MPQRRRLPLAAIGLAGGLATPALAGMPTPLPTHIDRVLRLNGTALERLQVISFFLLTFLVCAAVVMLLWNYIQRDIPRLPRLSFGRAMAIVFLWSLLFVIVLTMISGARELMTPGAWEKQGFTYKLTPAASLSAGDDKTQKP